MEKQQDPICRRVRENLAAYADGELETGELRRLIEQHLAECPECRLYLDQLKETWRLLDDLEPPVVHSGSSEFQSRIMARIQAESRQGPLKRTVLRFGRRTVATLAAGAVAAILFAGGLVRVMQPPAPQPHPADENVIAGLDFLQQLELLRRFETVDQLRQLGEELHAQQQAVASTVSPDANHRPLSDEQSIADILHRAAEALAAAAREAEIRNAESPADGHIAAPGAEDADG